MLGDIYTMPITGGKAKPIHTGLAWECQPSFSPDGKQILYTSDRDGADNIWVSSIDGSEAKQITKEDFRLLNNAIWSNDGEYIIARKHFTSTRSAGAGEMWMYHLNGKEGIQLTERKNDQQDVNSPNLSPDGKYLYFDEDMYPGGFFQYNKDPNNQIYVIRRLDMETGEIENITGGSGSAFRPVVSNDGQKLAFARRIRSKTKLFVKDLNSGKETEIFDQLEKDQTEAWAIFGSFPSFAWTPDDNNIIVYGKGGKIWNVNVDAKSGQVIPFEAAVNQSIADAVFFKQDIDFDKFKPKVIRGTETSPDGKQIVFSSVGKLYIKKTPNGKPELLTGSDELEYEPSFSSDGRKIVYVTWKDDDYGTIKEIDLTTKKISTLSDGKGIYRTPRYSPDGSKVVYSQEPGNDYQGFDWSMEPGIYLLNLKNNSIERISKEGEYPYFSEDSERIYYQTGGYLFGALEKGFHSVNLNGEDKRTHFTSKYTNRFVPSPDGKYIAFNDLHNAYIAPIPKLGKAIDLSQNTKSVPVVKVSKDAGYNLHWSGGGMNVHWMLGNEYYSSNITEIYAGISQGKEADLEVKPIAIGLEIDRYTPEGYTAFTNAKVITVNENNDVLDNATVLVKDNKIVGIGANVDIPEGTKIIDCAGKTLMPGLVDVHAHQGTFRYGLSPEKHWPYYASLAYGITTTHDPSSNSEMIFANSEMIKAGEMVGPRIFSTGTILYGAEGDFKAVVNSLEDARSHLRRTKAFGAFSVKSYNQPRRNQRQMVMVAARLEEMMVVPEGGSHFFHNMSMILDGHTGIEHNIPVAPLYDDVLNLWEATETHNTPTLIVSYGSVTGEYYWYQNTNVWEKERLLRFTPRDIIDSRSRHRTMIPDEEYENGHILVSKSLKKLNDRGVKVNMGSHGQIQGIGAHWEMWMLGQGGMTPMEVIRASTMNGADYLGLGHQIGSIEKGKLADIIVLEDNPLDDIMNTESVVYTMVDGRLFESDTMTEIGHGAKKAGQFWWAQEGSTSTILNFGKSHQGCTCGH
jgi:imidazolonepropionase-like amidohydrolase/Tol biopolymer transport system component